MSKQGINSATLNRGNKLYEKYDYKFAIAVYEKAMKTHPSLDIAVKLANCYSYVNDYVGAERGYAKVLTFANFNTEVYKYYADALRQNGKFSEAKTNYLKYAEVATNVENQTSLLIASCDSALLWQNNPDTQVKILAMDIVNSEFRDFSPVVSNQAMVFTSDRYIASAKGNKRVYGWTGNPYQKLYEYNIAQQRVTPLPTNINADYHSGTATFTTKRDTIYFTRTEMPSKKNRKGIKLIRNAIYYAVNQNGTWSQPIRILGNGKDYSAQHPSLSADGNLLYFAANFENGQGGMDIYVTRKNADNTWGTPVNCGTEINTSEDEVFPVAKGDNELYFSSKGRIGMGGLDIFKAIGSYTSFSTAQNLKSPLNSVKDDFGMVFTDNYSGYLSSNRIGGKGLDDIYEFNFIPVPSQIFAINGKVVKKGTTFSISGAKVIFTNLNTKQSTNFTSDNLGSFNINALAKETDYSLALYNSKGLMKQKVSISTKGLRNSKTFEVKLELEVAENDIVRLNNIYFNFNKGNIRTDSHQDLDKVVEYLKNTPLVQIELRAHTDARGDARYNQYLSQKRGDATLQYIKEKGIDGGRLKAKGLGESQLLNQCKDGVKCTNSQHSINRRVEFRVLDLNFNNKAVLDR